MKAKLTFFSLLFLFTSTQIIHAKTDPNWIVRGRALYVQPETKGVISGPKLNVDISSAQVPEFDISKFISPNLALELILATTKHDVNGANYETGNIKNTGSVKLLPPTLTLQYHANPTGTFRPYTGAGLNYTFFYGVKGENELNVKYKDNIGYALQAGFDYMIDDKIGINFDIKKIFLKTRVLVNDTYSGNVRIDPWIIGTGISYHF
jgi:outer membrane protein